ncbi:hypothetical protein L486_07229 [Kwoniella mangroviensis CBS 10435]|uniref:Uncharacterized protein n=1 Tax=Kwoniella mangroviensis CBS 10435 TaxID=1331196 RepID=A0A1B9IHF4_9TREE|nr:hypothetical protein L486_07229 [Kwoniella mangroviensis CBS 10435]
MEVMVSGQRGYTYVNPADYLTDTKNVDAQSGEPRIRRSGDSLPSSPNSFQDSIGTSLPQAQTESTPGTYYSPEMGSGRGKSADNRSGARYDSRQSPRAGKGLRRVRKKEQMGLR